jgi:non-heme chloroperoxidase
MTLLLVLVLVLVTIALVGVVAVVVGPRLVVARDRRRSEPGLDQELRRPLPDTRSHTVTTRDDARVHVVERGRGRPIVFVHGLSLTHQIWKYQYIDLADRFRVIAFDLRGHGASTEGADGYGPHLLGEDLATVLVALDLHDAIVVGHSLGGTAVGQLCADHPDVVADRVYGLVFVATYASALRGEGWWRETFGRPTATAMAAMQRRMKHRTEPPTGALAYAMARSPFGPDPRPEHVRFCLELGSRTSPKVAARSTVANLDYDVRAGLDEIDTPALVVAGSRDRLAPLRSARQLEQNLPNAELVVLEGAGHLLMLERRHELAELLSRFATKTADPAARESHPLDASS